MYTIQVIPLVRGCALDYGKAGSFALELTRLAVDLIRATRRAGITFTQAQEANLHVQAESPIMPVSRRIEGICTGALRDAFPSLPVVPGQKDPQNPLHSVVQDPAWVVHPLDGANRFIEGAEFGKGVQCAFIDEDGQVRIALVGDAVTRDIFGYYGDSGVFRIDIRGNWLPISSVDRSRPLCDHTGLHRPAIGHYHPLSQHILASGQVGEIKELVGGIGVVIAQLLTDRIGLFALHPHHERPWVAIPAYALCVAADMVFMTPTRNGFKEWTPIYPLETWKRDFDLLVMHRSRVPEFLRAVNR